MHVFIAKKEGKLSKLISEEFDDISYSLVMKLLRNKDIKVDGSRVSKDIKIPAGSTVEIYYAINKKEYFKTLFVDQNILVIDKKSGVTSEQVFSQLSGQYEQIYFIHRLDRNTSGVMVFALNGESENQLLDGFKSHSFIKEYIAEVSGILTQKSAILTAYLFKDSDNSLVKIYRERVKGSQQIKTGYEVISENSSSQTSILKVRLYTGKTHQIRAHLAFIGHPIIGDGKYGDYQINRKFKAKNQRLIAKQLTLKFPALSTLNYLDNKTFISEQNFGEG